MTNDRLSLLYSFLDSSQPGSTPGSLARTIDVLRPASSSACKPNRIDNIAAKVASWRRAIARDCVGIVIKGDARTRSISTALKGHNVWPLQRTTGIAEVEILDPISRSVRRIRI